MPRSREVVIARVPVTVLIEFILRTAPPSGYTVSTLWTHAAELICDEHLWVEEVTNAVEILVLEGRAKRVGTSSPYYLLTNSPNDRKLLEQQKSSA